MIMACWYGWLLPRDSVSSGDVHDLSRACVECGVRFGLSRSLIFNKASKGEQNCKAGTREQSKRRHTPKFALWTTRVGETRVDTARLPAMIDTSGIAVVARATRWPVVERRKHGGSRRGETRVVSIETYSAQAGLGVAHAFGERMDSPRCFKCSRITHCGLWREKGGCCVRVMVCATKYVMRQCIVRCVTVGRRVVVVFYV